ncbi:NUDIX hydrolase [Streptococcus cristatus]|uniref:Nucleoside triphosphate pyrophosphohydrolase n=1 Tax=Streptococcus cristatus TaxID=45634 RepID=A0A3R9SVR8_STRCR|nr:NUDIX hydrolase [Streptococcus cristatus]RSJ80966.1 nucleoside triphosphate pyrophosphohydrolase [Streptococcus cristatus]RSJ82366.1 nucleoside triphosphate pyrophosphohydrolase [Streptococcus cristatus]RSJ87501.1 nucleoside triphosphate pyrophosphohydrolase [Streptococcus cristatus]RSJ87967.1 nucleoside triphosphate pyrophosphohydrolase [Streptococcus cristatus]
MEDTEELDLLHKQMEFSGCKIALICDDKLLTILRDNISSIPWPNMWELPGGGREGEETPFECVQREVFEELGLKLEEADILWVKKYQGMLNPDKISIFMVGTISQEECASIAFGDEGQAYQMMDVSQFLVDEKVIPQLQDRLKDYLEEELGES